MKIRPSEIKLPEQLSLKWETVGGVDLKGRDGATKKVQDT